MSLKDRYLALAEENMPRINSEFIRPQYDSRAYNNGDSIVIDLGNHYVGYFSFTLGYTDIYPDAPVRLRVKFCESERDLDADFSSYKGELCASWLSEDIVNVDNIGSFRMTRRYAARYIKITVLYTPREITLSDFTFEAVTSADMSRLSTLSISDPELADIDRVAVNTLKNCMQRFFEDGPKRDRRLWIGDLRLEALTGYYTFNQSDIVKRCLYLFAAADTNASGFLPGYVYEYPSFASGCWFLEDYALLYVACLCDYYLHTGDEQTFLEIYPVAKSQINAAEKALDENGILLVREDSDVFIDWNLALKKITALNGVLSYTLDLLASALDKLSHEDAPRYRSMAEKSRRAARLHLYNKAEGNFANSYDGGQISVHSVVWMILGGVISGEEAFALLKRTMLDPASIKPVTPYMNHYLVEAMMRLGRTEEAIDYIKGFWGLMVKEGADTFYEIFVPGQPDFSPYGDRLINSMCHAWSCTPSYFIRALGRLGDSSAKD